MIGMRRINRKGDVPTILMFLVALVLTTGILFSFASFKDEFETEFNLRNDVAFLVSLYESHIESQSKILGGLTIDRSNGACSKDAFTKIVGDSDLGLEGVRGFYGNVSRGEFSFEKEGEECVLKIKGIVVEAETRKNEDRGSNKLKKVFNVEVRYDTNGQLIS